MNPLVSVIVVTYNSSEFIEELLESVFNQSWQELELIVTDDCSQDNTVDICQNWLNRNKQRFVHSEIITVGQNTGVPANANRGLYRAKGDWIIFPAGDDVLKPNCIKDNMTWIAAHPEIRVLFSYIDVYNNEISPENYYETIPADPFNPNSIMARNRSADSQYKLLLRSDKIHYTPSAFLERNTLLSIGGFDERFKLLEDHPLWLNLTSNGHKLYFMDKNTVNYRRHIGAINNTGITYLINPNYFKLEGFRRVYTYPHLPFDVRLQRRLNWYLSQVFRLKAFNKDNKLNRFLLDLLTTYLNPFKYIVLIRKQLNRNLKNNEFYL